MATAVESAPELEVADPEAAPVPKLVEEVESRLVVDAHTDLGESPTWDARTGRLYFVDINKATIHVFTVETGVRPTRLVNINKVQKPVCLVALRNFVYKL
jgi:sugar lactone lactonase YvrE